MNMEDEIDVVEVLGSANMEWTTLGDTFVKFYPNYDDLEWDIDVSKHKIAIAPYGGPVAVLLKSKGEPLLHIYNLTGSILSRIKFEGGKIVNIGWTASERLISVFEDGTIVVHSLQGERLYTSPLAREVHEGRVLDCKFFHTLEGYSGFAVMTYEYRFFVVSDSDRDRDSLRVKAMAELPSSSIRPSCWAVLPQGNNVGVVAAVEDRVFLLLPFEAVPMTVACRKGSPQWSFISISLNGKAAALVDKEGYIWAGSSDFKSAQTDFDMQEKAQARQVEWSGSDFLAILFDRFVYLKGLGKHWCKLPIVGPAVMQQELDGVRLLSNTCCEFMHRVSSSTLSVLKVASLQPGAILNDAYKEYKGDESHKADEFIRFVKDRLSDAVKQCITAASEEYNPQLQQALLMSADFGKGFIGPDVSDELVQLMEKTCRDLRVLNTIRHKEVGIPITYRQYARLSHGVLMDRLIERGLYPLALAVCKYLKMAPADGEVKILRHWALRKVRDPSTPDNTDTADLIMEKFKEQGVVISFVDIARAAREERKDRLAAQLLEHECLVSDQVQMLLEMRENERALDKAIGSWDSQLVYEVLETMKAEEKTEEFMGTFHNRPVAAALYKKYCKQYDRAGLVNLCRLENNYLEAGVHCLAQSYSKNEASAARGRMIPDERLLKEAHKEFLDGQLMFHVKVVEEQDRLIREQETIQQEHKIDLLGLSLFDTILELLRKDKLKLADSLRKKFAMSDQLYWWARIRGLADVANYEEIERFSKQKKSPIGYEPFVEICLQRNRFREATKYIPRCNPENRCKLYMLTGDWIKAAESAFAEKDVASLNEIQARQGRNPDIAQMVKQMKAKLGVL